MQSKLRGYILYLDNIFLNNCHLQLRTHLVADVINDAIRKL
jgi:hypothetical protein